MVAGMVNNKRTRSATPVDKGVALSSSCPHLVALKSRVAVSKIAKQKDFKCNNCGNSESVWICLTCGLFACGRYANAHMKRHNTSSKHPIAMDLSTTACHCYLCDDFVVGDTESGLVGKLREIFKSARAGDESEDEPLIKEPPPTKNAKSARALSRISVASSAPERRVGEIGLVNLGNTCFMNSVLQGLSTVPALRQYFLDTSLDDLTLGDDLLPPGMVASEEDDEDGDETYDPSSKQKKRKVSSSSLAGVNKEVSALQSMGPMGKHIQMLQKPTTRGGGAQECPSVSKELQSLIRVLWSPEDEISKVFSPDSFLMTVWRIFPMFQGFQQHDAHEFLRILLDRVHSELKRSPGRDPRESPSSVTNDCLSGSSVITDLFRGELVSKVTCLKCQRTSTTVDPFLDLSLDIPERCVQFTRSGRANGSSFADVKSDSGDRGSGGVCTLGECIDAFMAHEDLQDGDRFYCPHCRELQTASKRITAKSMPPIVCLHLKRFRWQAARQKITTVVSYPDKDLDFGAHLDETYTDDRGRSTRGRKKVVYDLVSVIMHHGTGGGSGHYTAHCLHSSTMQWLHFNDGYVHEVSVDDVLSSQAYMLVYKRRD